MFVRSMYGESPYSSIASRMARKGETLQSEQWPILIQNMSHASLAQAEGWQGPLPAPVASRQASGRRQQYANGMVFGGDVWANGPTEKCLTVAWQPVRHGSAARALTLRLTSDCGRCGFRWR